MEALATIQSEIRLQSHHTDTLEDQLTSLCTKADFGIRPRSRTEADRSSGPLPGESEPISRNGERQRVATSRAPSRHEEVEETP